MNEISVVTREISVLFLKNCENCLFLLIFMKKKRLNVQDDVPSLNEDNDDNDDSETSQDDPEYDSDSEAEPEDHNDSEDIPADIFQRNTDQKGVDG